MNRLGLLVLLFAFAAGGALGYVAGTGSGDEGLVIGEADPARPPTPVSAPDTEDESSPLPRVGRRSLREVIEAISVPVPERGTGVITGHVRLQDGTPLSGAFVRATADRRYWNRPVRGGPPPGDDLEKLVREQVERLLAERSHRATSLTGPDGSYTLTGLNETRYRLEGWLEGYYLKPAVWRTKPGGVVDFVATPVVRIPLTVLLPDGTPPQNGASILARMGERQENQWWTSGAGAIALEPGTWTLLAQCGDNNEYRSEEAEVTVEAGVAVEPVTLRLNTQPGIMGRVLFPPGDNQSYCQVKVLRILPGKDADPKRLLREGKGTYAHASSGGAYAFHGLSAGTYLVGLFTPDRQKVVASATVEVAGEMVEKDLEYPAPDPGDCLVVRVEGPDGKLVSDVSFNTGYASNQGGGSGGGRFTRLPDGRYRVPHYEMDPERETPEGRHYIEVHSARYGSTRVEYVRAATEELHVQFEPPATLEVVVLGYAGSEYEGRIRLSVQRAGGGRDMRTRTRFSPGQEGLSSEGVQKLGPLAPGEYELSLSVTTENRTTTVSRETVTLKPGPNKQTVAVPALYSLTVMVDGAPARTRVYLRSRGRGGDFGWWSRSGRVEDGRVVFDGVPAGEYTLSASGPLSGQMDVTVPGRGVVRFVPRPVNAYLVTITEPTGGFAASGLREGDLVVGVDGTEFTDQAQIGALMTLARKKNTATLSVQRGRSRLDISIDLAKYGLGNREAGGHLTPTAR